jgi:hypothetical protein
LEDFQNRPTVAARYNPGVYWAKDLLAAALPDSVSFSAGATAFSICLSMLLTPVAVIVAADVA